MAKTSTVEKWKRNKAKCERLMKYRAELKEIIRKPSTTDEDRYEAQWKLQKLPRRALPVQQVNRCILTGRSKGVFRKFNLSRIKFRELAHKGALPGVSKASW